MLKPDVPTAPDSLALRNALMEATPLAIVALDTAGRVTTWNLGAERMFGWTAAEAIGQLVPFVPPEKTDESNGIRQLTLHGESIANLELRRRKKNGDWIAVSLSNAPIRDVTGQVIGVVGVMADITERQTTEQALRDSEVRYRTVVEAAQDVIFTIAPDTQITSLNAAFETLTGWPREQWLGKSFVPLLSPEGVFTAQAMLQQVLRGDATPVFELPFQTKDGHPLVGQLQIAALRQGTHITGVLGIARDVTEHKRIEQALRDSEELFRSLSASTPLGIFLTDTTGACVYSNPQCRVILGTTMMETLGSGWMKRIHPDDLVEVRREWDDSIRDRLSMSKEFRLLLPDTKPIWVHLRTAPMQTENGVWRGQVATIENITQRRQSQQRLEHSEERYRTLFETMREGFAFHEIICNATGQPCDYRFLEANSMFEELTGLKRYEILGRTALEIMPNTEPFWITTYGRVALTGESTHFEHFAAALGKTYEVFAFSPKRGQFAAVFLDITQRKRAELNLVETNQRLEKVLDELKTTQSHIVQEERLRALGTMASGIAHDFNNTLAAILGFSELLLSHPEILTDKERTLRYLQMMNTAAKDAGEVVNRLREFYRHREVGEVFAAVEVNPLVRQAIELTQPKWQAQAQALGRTIEVQTQLLSVPMVAGNAAELREVLTNLIINAVDAMPQGGTITLRTHVQDAAVCIAVTDTGTGMTEEVRRRCLEPFFSTKGSGGTGLGLSMVYGTIQRHQGEILIDTAPGHGTTFTIKLPAMQNPNDHSPTPATSPAGHSLSVLLVDDEDSLRMVISALLESEGHTIVTAPDGGKGLEEFRRRKFDVVIVDRAMPGLSGDQVATAIKSIAPTQPIILLTGFGSLMASMGEIPDGVDLVLGKPVTLAVLSEALAKVVAQH